MATGEGAHLVPHKLQRCTEMPREALKRDSSDHCHRGSFQSSLQSLLGLSRAADHDEAAYKLQLGLFFGSD